MTAKQLTFELTPANIKEAMKDAGASSGDLWKVPFDQLYVIPGFNVRELDDPAYREHIDHLKALIRENGYDLDKPMAGYALMVQGDRRIAITNGHSRHIALTELREEGVIVETVPVVLASKGSSVEDLTVSLVTSNEGKALSPYELGTVIKRLVGYGWEEDQISKKLNVTKKYVNDLLYLHSLPAKIRDLVRKGKVSAAIAIAAVKQHGDKAYAVLTQAVKEAQDKGREKASAKDMAPVWKTEVKKQGAKLYDTLMWVKEDPHYAKLSEATRHQLEKILSELPPEPEDVANKSRGEE